MDALELAALRKHVVGLHSEREMQSQLQVNGNRVAQPSRGRRVRIWVVDRCHLAARRIGHGRIWRRQLCSSRPTDDAAHHWIAAHRGMV
jgi:hypothetical protein